MDEMTAAIIAFLRTPGAGSLTFRMTPDPYGEPAVDVVGRCEHEGRPWVVQVSVRDPEERPRLSFAVERVRHDWERVHADERKRTPPLPMEPDNAG